MSGIGGIFRRNKQKINLDQLKSIGSALAHRGPDGITYFKSNHIGFVHCMLHDTPESLFEKLPGKTDDERLVITWHGRIDNREQLRDKTGYIRPLAETADSDLILAAYDKWGSDCVNYLLGDFVFAIWDESAQKIFCARDHMGIKPFYYILTEKLFCFASEIKGLLTIPEFDRTINEERIADYLTCFVTEKKSTFYKNIFRLQPGHSLEVDLWNSNCQCYWEPRPAKLSCRNNVEYEEEFYSIFENAVSRRLRSNFPIGSFLSGGLDSSAIVCMASGPQQHCLPSRLHTFSGIFDKISKCDERIFFQSVLDRYNVIPHFIPADQINPGIAYNDAFENEDEPFWAPHFFMGWNLMALAKKNGIRVMLDGHDGDSAVSHGTGLLPELLLSGRWFQLINECNFIGNSHSFKKTIKTFLNVCKNSALFKISSVLPVTFQPDHFVGMVDNLNESLMEKHIIRERLFQAEAERPKFGQTEYEHHKRSITNPMHSVALEFLERQCVRHKLVGRYPFFDKNLIEFCLALPPQQKFCNGFNRNIVRKSLKHIVPDNIIKRKSKTDFSPNMKHTFSSSGKPWLKFNIDRLFSQTYNFINRDKFCKLSEKYLHNPLGISFLELNYILRSISLAQWFEKKMEKKMQKQHAQTPELKTLSGPNPKLIYSKPEIIILGSAEELTKSCENGSSACDGTWPAKRGDGCDPCS